MSREANLATQQRLGEYVKNSELDKIAEVFTPDVVDHDPAPDQPQGAQGFTAFFTALKTAFPDASLAVDKVVADDDNISIAYRLSGTHKGTFHGVPATGKHIEVRGLQIGRFENGKIAERWGSSDELGILKQIGVKLPE